MQNLYGDSIGLLHLLSSTIALIAGAMTLMMDKGTKRHKQIGYVYVVSMLILLTTAFMIYRLFDGWGIFHYATVASLLTLAGGMVPVLIKKPEHSWRSMHFGFMYWSVMGLYAAFAAEALTRIPNSPFFGMVGIATFVIMGAAHIFYRKYQKKWNRIKVSEHYE